MYRVIEADGTTYEGGAPEYYFQTKNGEPLRIGEPGPGEQIEGMLSVVIVRNGDAQVRVAMPDNKAIIVSKSQVSVKSQEPACVPF